MITWRVFSLSLIHAEILAWPKDKILLKHSKRLYMVEISVQDGFHVIDEKYQPGLKKQRYFY